MPRRTRMICALALAVGAATLSACGSEEEFDGSLSPDQSRALLDQVEAVEQAVGEEDCTTAQTDAQQLIGAVNALPAEVGTELKDALRKTSENLLARVQQECVEPIEPTTTDEVDPVEPEIEEAPPETDTETETEPETPEEPEDDGDDGPGGGNGNGPPEDPGNSGGTAERGAEG